MDGVDLRDLGMLGTLLIAVGTGIFTFLKWNRVGNLEDQENRLKEVRALVESQRQQILDQKQDLDRERRDRMEAEARCDERINDLGSELAAAKQLNARMLERLGRYEDALKAANIPFRPFDPGGSDYHRPMKDRRTGTRTDTGDRRRRTDGEGDNQ